MHSIDGEEVFEQFLTMTTPTPPTSPCRRIERLKRREQHRPIPEPLRRRNQIVLQHLGLAHHAANQQLRRGGGEYDDLHQEALVGVMNCLASFDPTRGHRLSSYVMPRAIGQILHYRRDRLHTLRIPWRLKDLHTHGMRLQEQRLHEGQHPLSDDDLANALGVSKHRWQQARCAHLDQHLVPLNAPIATRGEGRSERGERIDQLVARERRMQNPQELWLQEALQSLDSDLRRWVWSHWVEGIPIYRLADQEQMDRRELSRLLKDTLEELRFKAESTRRSSPPGVPPLPSRARQPRPFAAH